MLSAGFEEWNRFQRTGSQIRKLAGIPSFWNVSRQPTAAAGGRTPVYKINGRIAQFALDFPRQESVCGYGHRA